MKVGIVGCGLIGAKRAAALGQDELLGCFDTDSNRSVALADAHGGRPTGSLEELLGLGLDVVVVATTHDQLSAIGREALAAGAHILVEKPAGTSSAQVAELEAAASTSGRLVKVGFNHRFHPAIARAVTEARSGEHGEIMFARARYGHGGRLGYEREWRMRREMSGGGEMIDQGMHLLDLFFWLLGPVPVHSALMRTHFWDAEVEDNAVIALGAKGRGRAPWGLFHVSWTEWKNMFSLEIYCRNTKLQVDGLAGSYGRQRLTIHRMKPELGPPDTEVLEFPTEDVSWEREWEHLREAVEDPERADLLGDLASARYAWESVERAYALADYPTAEIG